MSIIEGVTQQFDRARGLAGNVLGFLPSSRAAVPSTINSMVANIAAYKIAYPYKYEIAFTRFSGTPLENLRLCVSCEKCTMPGKTIATQEIKYHGPVYEMPYEESYAGDMEAVFKLSGDFFERKVFEKWQREIVNPKTHNFKYFDDYVSEIEITQLDLEDNPICRVILEDAYPKTIGPLDFGDEPGEVHKQPISFSYRKWRYKEENEPGFLESILNRLDIVGRLNRVIMEGLSEFPVPMIPTAIGGHVVNLPWGLDPGQMQQQGEDIVGNWAGQALGDFI